MTGFMEREVDIDNDKRIEKGCPGVAKEGCVRLHDPHYHVSSPASGAMPEIDDVAVLNGVFLSFES